MGTGTLIEQAARLGAIITKRRPGSAGPPPPGWPRKTRGPQVHCSACGFLGLYSAKAANAHAREHINPRPFPLPLVGETFKRPQLGSFGSLVIRDNPSCAFNYEGPSVIRYRVTIEAIEEPHGVIAERLQRLWETCGNYHHADTFRAAARLHGVELEGPRGARARPGLSGCGE